MTTQTSQIVELRRYALHPGARETLIELFDREFVETQEAVGMRVLGQFRDLDDPDSFVWFRGFRDMESRKDALEAFYGGPIWKEHANAANATMIDVDNVLLLRPVSGLALDPAQRPGPGSIVQPPGVLVVTVHPLTPTGAESFETYFSAELEPLLSDAGVSVLATYATERSPNTFPQLPVRDEEVFVWMAMFANLAEHRSLSANIGGSPAWREHGVAGSGSHVRGPAEILRLTPTARSLLHG